MHRVAIAVALAIVVLIDARAEASQAPSVPPADPSRPWEITDNSFLIEESFNQDANVVQNIFTWTHGRDGAWAGSFTQEWPVPGMTHQLSYTMPFARVDGRAGVGDVLLNYRYQLRKEDAAGPAVAPRVSLILPTGRQADGLGSGTAGLQFAVPVSKQFGDLYLHGNVGFTWLPNVTRTPYVGGSSVWRATPALNLMLEALWGIGDSVIVSPGFRRGWDVGGGQLVLGAALPISRQGGRGDVALLTYFSYERRFR